MARVGVFNLVKVQPGWTSGVFFFYRQMA